VCVWAGVQAEGGYVVGVLKFMDGRLILNTLKPETEPASNNIKFLIASSDIFWHQLSLLRTGSSSVVKRPEREADLSSPSSAKVTIAWSCTTNST
jgi:hypothetical protein